MIWKWYKRKELLEMRPYVVGEDLSGVSGLSLKSILKRIYNQRWY